MFSEYETCTYMFNVDHFDVMKPIVGFDVDGTLIKPFYKFSHKVDDYDYMIDKDIIDNIHSHANVVLFTNQSRCNETTLLRLQRIMKHYDIHHCFVATKKDKFRKPESGMFDLFMSLIHKKKNDYTCKKGCYFVGDAGGREHDFSDSDKLFASTIGFKFFHITDFLQMVSNDNDENINKTDVKKEQHDELDHTLRNHIETLLHQKKQILLLMMGFPASGKSTVSRSLSSLFPFEIASNDIHQSKTKSVAKQWINEGKHVIIDNTNVSQKQRAEWVSLASDHVHVVCIHMTTPYEVCQERNKTREKKVPMVALSIARKNFSPVSKDEGIHDVLLL